MHPERSWTRQRPLGEPEPMLYHLLPGGPALGDGFFSKCGGSQTYSVACWDENEDGEMIFSRSLAAKELDEASVGLGLVDSIKALRKLYGRDWPEWRVLWRREGRPWHRIG